MMILKVGERVFLKEYGHFVGTIIRAKSDSVYSVEWKNMRTNVKHLANHWAEMLILDDGYNDFFDKIEDRIK